MTDRFTPTTAAASDVFASVDAYKRIAESARADQQVEVKAKTAVHWPLRYASA